MSVLILAEKPPQAKAYSEAFPNVQKKDGYYYVPPCSLLPTGGNITWAIGHLVELNSPEDYKEEWKNWDLSKLPILPERYVYKVSPSKRKQFNIVKRLMKEADTLTVAVDIDREGEAIARLIIQQAGCTNKKINRLWINSLEVDEIKKGFQNLKPGEEKEDLFHEAQARQLSDWIVGMNASRLYTLLLRQKGVQGVYSVGRCQTPALCLINKRQQEIKNFKPTPFFELEAQFTSPNGIYRGRYKERFATKGELMNLLQQHNLSENSSQQGMIKSVEVKPKQKEAPKLFSLSSIQALANKKYKYSPADVLKGIQELYEAKLVTYPRTDCNYITEGEFEYLKNNLSGYQSIADVNFPAHSLSANKRYVDNKKVQEHYAIVLTKNVPSKEIISKLPDKQRNLYMEVLKSVLSMFHAPYMYEETVITSDLNGMLFTTKGKAEISLGWKELYITDKIEEEDDQEKVSLLPVVKQGEFVQGLVKSKEGVTTPPKPYTEGQLITMMKTCGSSVEDEESKGILKEVEGLGTLLAKPEMTAKWEGYLRKIGKKQGSKDVFVSQTSKFITNLIEEATKSISEMKIDNKIQEMKSKDTVGKCPKCGKDVVNRKTFYGCSGYKEGCKFSIPSTYLTKKISEANVKKLLEGKKTGLIKKMKSQSGKEFDGHLKLTSSGRLDLEFAAKK
ncbi:DNA topoisomerase [Bacillus thuringiensis]|uniref:type IA DNA topoisomerase n=1 Tax=Bacillus thuringiensis TaxID=1428 RepID=UPI002DBD06F5|nr:DNA topoisomerase [Bacillus thuringiensis]MEC3226111.1 DNA topoisomerase [Bacillus thuringiensis]MEC3463193.1 DNA topoisomerase [Bacillus thuringiensis]MEC3555392.1 DNA topoisomerase [Bacillus thuringiensis]MED2058877.1 DNA topoisomerase [Bacillus thuringiensis]